MKFELRYTGSAVENGRMDARVLGPAILGIAEVLEGTSEAIYADRGRLRVEVDADFQQGSFLIEFVAGANVTQLIPLGLQELANIAQIAGFTGGSIWSVVKLIRWQRGRKIKRVEPEEQTDRIRITIENQTIIIPRDTYSAFANPEVRQGFEDLVKPLQQEGIRAVEVSAGERGREVIRSEEAPLFAKSLLPQQKLPPQDRKAFLEVLSPTFKEGNKWEFRHNNQTFHAEILDQSFLQKVRRREITFGQGDTLRVLMRIEETIDGAKVHAARKIVQVLQYYPASQEEDEQQKLL
jgi:hypothetical protein